MEELLTRVAIGPRHGLFRPQTCLGLGLSMLRLLFFHSISQGRYASVARLSIYGSHRATRPSVDLLQDSPRLWMLRPKATAERLLPPTCRA